LHGKDNSDKGSNKNKSDKNSNTEAVKTSTRSNAMTNIVKIIATGIKQVSSAMKKAVMINKQQKKTIMRCNKKNSKM